MHPLLARRNLDKVGKWPLILESPVRLYFECIDSIAHGVINDECLAVVAEGQTIL
jgi:hypothetical protein